MSPAESEISSLTITPYYNFRRGASTGAVTSNWHIAEVGIIKGCVISLILFSLAMKMRIKSAEPDCRGPKTTSVQHEPSIMDDLTITTKSVQGCRWILKGEADGVGINVFQVSQIKIDGAKKGKVEDKFRFSVAGETIPSITEKPVKSLGNVFDSMLKVAASIGSTYAGWLAEISGPVRPAR